MFRIKDSAWEKIFPNEPNPGPKEALYMPAHQPFDNCVMLTYPFHWWRMDEVEEIKNLF